ncbi:FeoB-associated Cys-rich membrane protein [Vibrio sp. JPW-9-11-11]|uniref:FeoB-associated Cys-rich membrane protein n=1 Tax=Vibrio sp. JPW-9-11-11 TaxID=1416532 RepID=UPI0015940919|nr:FeoB-associated Cys-rich membrane protein [Vibrio sp. JPW-9-11-11]NVD05604.1 FeoB-associated Cys-rich membrane protein [Vibrio sp. JPW-9-11-11]
MFEQHNAVLDVLALIAIVSVAVLYLYIRLVKRKASCGNGCGGCPSAQDKTL